MEHVTENLRLRLDGVPRLDTNAQIIFEDTTENWYHEIYQSDDAHFRRLRRQLQLNGVVDFSTVVSFRAQHSMRNGTVVNYDQFVSFQSVDNETFLDPLTVILDPFEHPLLRERYVDELRISEAIFQKIPNRAIVIPDPDFIFDDDGGIFEDEAVSSGGQGNGFFLLSAILSAVVGGLAVLLILVLKRRRNIRKAAHRNPKVLLRDGSSYFFDEPIDEQSSSHLQVDYMDKEVSSAAVDKVSKAVLSTIGPPRFSEYTAEDKIKEESKPATPKKPSPFHSHSDDAVDKRSDATTDMVIEEEAYDDLFQRSH